VAKVTAEETKNREKTKIQKSHNSLKNPQAELNNIGKDLSHEISEGREYP